MKKENFGIPTSLLNTMIYALALYVAINYGTVFWVMIGLTVVVFALGFSSTVKKTVLQADVLILLFIGANLIFDFIGIFFSFADPVDFSGESVYSKYTDVVNVIEKIFNIIAYVVFVLLALMALAKKDLFVASVHKAVDGFVPRPVVQPQGYAGQPQGYAGQPQGYAGQPQNYQSQPQCYQGQPLNYQSQPQGYQGQSQSYQGQPQGYTNQPQQK